MAAALVVVLQRPSRRSDGLLGAESARPVPPVSAGVLFSHAASPSTSSSRPPETRRSVFHPATSAGGEGLRGLLAGSLASIAMFGSRRRHFRRDRAALVPQEARKRRKGAKTEEKKVAEFVLLPEAGMSVSDLGSLAGIDPTRIVEYFFVHKGKALKLTDHMDLDMCKEFAERQEIEVLIEKEQEQSEAANRGFLTEEYWDADPRPPVVTVMGHVDHGKTTLLDTIRQRSVAATEAGGITQRIGAYTVEVDGEKITFIDTPGHEAFSAMRARGAQVTDIAILVVAADDGVMPQTREAIAHAKAAEVPIIVAINKCDLPSADPEGCRKNLVEEGLVPEEWGGDIAMVEISAKKNMGIDNLLEIVSLTAEVSELKAKYDGPAAGVVLESEFDQGKGHVCSMLVQRGTLRVGDSVCAGTAAGRVRAMINEAGKSLKECKPSEAVQMLGMMESPGAGDQFEVYETIQEAKAVAEERQAEIKMEAAKSATKITTDQAFKLAIVLKTDAQGTIAAVKQLFSKVKDEYVNLRWLLTAAGPVSDTDIDLAKACPKEQRAVVIAFNTTVLPTAAKRAVEFGVELREFNIIYELFETMVGMLTNEIGPQEKLTEMGRAEVLAVFEGVQGKVAGVRVQDGMFSKGNRVKVYKGVAEVGEGTIISLRQGKSEVEDVEEGNECGFILEEFSDWEEGYEVRAFVVSAASLVLTEEKKKSRRR